MIPIKTRIASITACALLFLCGCTSLGHYGAKDGDESKRVAIIISKGVVVEKVDDTRVLDAAGSNMQRTMTVNAGMRTFLVRYWRVIPDKGARVSTHMIELKKEVQSGKTYRIVAHAAPDTVALDIVEVTK